MPVVDDGDGRTWWLRRQVVAEDLAQHAVHHGMQSLLGEAVPVFFGLPHVDVAEPALGALDRQVEDQPRRWLVADASGDALVEGGVDGHILGKRVGHGGSSERERFDPSKYRMKYWPR